MKKSPDPEHLRYLADCLEKLNEETNNVGLGKLMQRLASKQKEIDKLQETVNSFIEISGCTNEGRAKEHFKNLKRSANIETLSQDLDPVWRKPSAPMLHGTMKRGDVEYSRRVPADNIKKKLATVQETVLRLYALIEKYPDKEQIESRFKKEYNTYGYDQFMGRLLYYVEQIEPEPEITHTPLCSVLVIAEGLYPSKLIEDFIECGEKLGEVKIETVEKIEMQRALGEEEKFLAGVKGLLSLALHRANGKKGQPCLEEESVYNTLLSTKDDCPRGEEWIVTENTRLQDLLEAKLEEEQKEEDDYYSEDWLARELDR